MRNLIVAQRFFVIKSTIKFRRLKKIPIFAPGSITIRSDETETYGEGRGDYEHLLAER